MENQDFIKDENVQDTNDFINQENIPEGEEFTFQTVPFSRIIVGLTESALCCFIKDEAKQQQFKAQFESQAFTIPELLNFDEVMSRKLLSGKGMTDNEVIIWGLAWVGGMAALSFFSVNPIQLKKKKVKQIEKTEGKEGEKNEDHQESKGNA